MIWVLSQVLSQFLVLFLTKNLPNKINELHDFKWVSEVLSQIVYPASIFQPNTKYSGTPDYLTKNLYIYIFFIFYLIKTISYTS